MSKMTPVHAVLKRHHQRTRRVVAVVSLALLVVGAASCADHGAALTTTPVAKPLPLFHLSLLRRTSDFFYGLTVMRCGDNTPYWTFGDRGAKGSPPDTVTYGVPPRGYETSIGPVPLDPGCYRVLITGGASTRFSVERDGHIVALDDSSIVTTTTSAPPATPDTATHRPSGPTAQSRAQRVTH
jgi:hypothetical protein